MKINLDLILLCLCVFNLITYSPDPNHDWFYLAFCISGVLYAINNLTHYGY